MEDNLKRVEIGCGSTKTEGYIGVDRFPLPGVDLIADLNHQRLPFEDASVDVIYACHSLEHMDSLEQIVSEIYRVCKHKSIVMILAPYSATSLNMANFYHKSVFNEDTFRLFSSNSTQRIMQREYACPHAQNWGLGQSDNSEKKVELEILSMELFYYQEFRHLSVIEKLHARKSLTNVCDQIYYVLAVNKSEVPFTLEELEKLYQQAQQMEPVAINSLRERDREWQDEQSIITDITQSVLKQQQSEFARIGALEQNIRKQEDLLKERTEKYYDDLVQYVEKHINAQKDDYTQRLAAMQSVFETNFQHLSQICEQNMQTNQELSVLVESLSQKQDSISAVTLELLQARERNSPIPRRFSVFNRKKDYFPIIQQSDISFTDGLIFSCPVFGPKSILTLSVSIPFNGYFEYQMNGYGNRIHYFLIANIGAKLFVEVVQNGKITKQEHIIVNREGHHCIDVDSIKGRVSIRFKSMDNKSIIRILEIGNRNLFVLAKRSIAAFVD